MLTAFSLNTIDTAATTEDVKKLVPVVVGMLFAFTTIMPDAASYVAQDDLESGTEHSSES